MIYWFRYVPDQFILLIPVILIFISIYSYVNLNILTNDNYYNGFPAIWNVIVLYFYIFGTSQNFNLIFLILLILLKFSPLKCIHPLRVKKFKSLSKDQVVELNNRLVIGLFHQAKSCDKSEIVKIDNHQVTGLFCEFRNNTPDEQLQSGMGDIFIKLAR